MPYALSRLSHLGRLEPTLLKASLFGSDRVAMAGISAHIQRERERERERDRQTDRYIDVLRCYGWYKRIQRERERDRQTDRQTDR